MVRKLFIHALLVTGILSVAAVSCGKVSQKEEPVVRYMEISSPMIEVDGKAHTETVNISTNYERIDVSGGDIWCTFRLSADNKSVTVSVSANPGEARQTSVVLKGVAAEGNCTRSILVKQEKDVVIYCLDCSTIDFSGSNVVDVMQKNDRIAQVCLEYIYTSDKSVDRQTAVLYPATEDGTLDLANGIEIATGAKIEWADNSEADACTCSGGDGKPVTMLYFQDGKVFREYEGDATRVSLQLSPALISDIRGAEISTYRYVKIGTQYWMAENLKAEKYSNGKALVDFTAQPGDWDSVGSFLYYLYDQEDFKQDFGTLYNGHAVLSEEGLAPKGWEIPSMARWNKLYTYLRNNRGTKVKVAEWIWPDEVADYANITGMSIDLAYCFAPDVTDSGWNDEAGERTYFWSTEKVEKGSKTYLQYVYFFKSSPNFGRSSTPHPLYNGNYVRCVKDVR